MGMPELEIYSMIRAEGFARLVAAFIDKSRKTSFWGPCTRRVIFQGPSNASEIS
jgi:hypothetical protein